MSEHISLSEALKLQGEIVKRLDAEREEMYKSQQEPPSPEQIALYRIWCVAVTELEIQSRLSAAEPGSIISSLAYEALGGDFERVQEYVIAQDTPNEP